MDDPATPPNFSIRIARESPDATVRRQPLSFLYRGATKVGRSRGAIPLFEQLFTSLEAHASAKLDGVLRVRALAFVRGDHALLGPGALARSWPALEPRLRRAGVQMIDGPVLQVSPTDAALVVPEGRLHIDRSVLAVLSGPPAAGLPEVEGAKIVAGRYRISAWMLDSTDTAAEVSTAHAVAQVMKWLPDAGALHDPLASLEALGTLFRQTPRVALVADERVLARQILARI